MKRKLLLGAAALAVLNARPALAWDDFGHSLVARIAWENMTPQARARAVEILRGAPSGSGLGRGFPPGTLSPEQQVRLFVSAATWPDDIKSGGHPGHRFDNRNRHFVNLFWEQRFDFGPIRASSRAPFGELLNDLPRLRTALTGSDRGEAAMALAWILHLVGDVHQPLHSSSRITPLDRDGDRGGNDFGVRGSTDNLHSFWDGVVTRSRRCRPGEAPQPCLARVAQEIAGDHPRDGFAAQLASVDFRAWADEGLRLAQRTVYRAPLRRNRFVPASYERRAAATADAQVALAGYRLADLLNRAIG
ncbi:MAG TPA: S1/P1 nuclease [Longimicrobium sp.]|jgi:hypothetical protein